MPSQPRLAAEKILALRRMDSGPDTFVPAKPDDFPHLDMAAYAAFQSELRKHGFQDLGDVENLKLAALNTVERTMFRGMLSSDGYVKAAYFQVKSMFWPQVRILLKGLLHGRFIDALSNFIRAIRACHCVEFATEFSDGRHLSTHTQQPGMWLSLPASIDSYYFPASTPTATLLARHRTRIEEILEENKGLRPVFMASMEDVMQMVRRGKALRDSHRAAIGWITREELLGITRGDAQLADALFLEIETILAGERGELPASWRRQGG